MLLAGISSLKDQSNCSDHKYCREPPCPLVTSSYSFFIFNSQFLLEKLPLVFTINHEDSFSPLPRFFSQERTYVKFSVPVRVVPLIRNIVYQKVDFCMSLISDPNECWNSLR